MKTTAISPASAPTASALASTALRSDKSVTANFLLRCLSLSTSGGIDDGKQAIAQEVVDWQAIAQLAKTHRVLPLLYRRLESCPDIVPAAVLKELRQYCQNTAVRNLFVTGELSRLLSLLSSAGIDAMPYKGPVLAQALYADLNLRQFGDLDIVIQPQDMLAVKQLLVKEGYRPYLGEKSEQALADYMADKNQHTYDFYHDQKKIFIEVHWRFWPVFFSSVSPNDIWDRREPRMLGGITVSNLKAEDRLIILCMHGSRHRWQRLAWLCDIAMLLETSPELDWKETITTARQWGALRMLYLGLCLAHSWLNASLPDQIREDILSDLSTLELTQQIGEQLFSDEPPKRFLASTRYQIKARERWRDKATCAQAFIYWLLRGCPSEHHDS